MRVRNTTAAGSIDIEALIGAVQAGEESKTLRLLARLQIPSGDLLTGVDFMTGGEDVQARLLGLQCLASYLRGRGDVRLAADMQLALVAAFEKLGWLAASNPSARLLAVANVIDSCAGCLTDGGRAPELLRLAPQWSSWLLGVHLFQQWRGVQRAYVEACFHAGRLEDGAAALAALEHRFPDCREAPIERRLFDKLDNLLRSVDRPDAPAAGLDWVVKRTLKEFGLTNVPEERLDELTPERAAAATDRLGGLIGVPAAPAALADLRDAIEQLPWAGNPILQTGSVVGSLHEFFASGKASYAEVASLAARARACALQYGFWEQACSLGWLEAVALKRSGAILDACAKLAELRRTIHERQQEIQQPMLRAALAEYLPHLSGLSAELLFGLGREEELFEVIEASKGQILHALMGGLYATRLGEPVLSEMRVLLKASQHPLCYMTFLVDDDFTYVVAVTQDGGLHASRLGIGRAVIASAARELGFLIDGEPGSLTREAGIDPDSPDEADFSPTLSVLVPLGEWLSHLFKEQILQDETVLCLSPDGPMYNLPLGLVEVDGRPLLERAAVALEPSAVVMLACAARASPPPMTGFAATVPRFGEFDSGLYSRELYERDANSLREQWPSPTAREWIEPKHLLAEDLSEAVVHIGSHGTFAVEDPLNASGMMLASGGRLPGENGYEAAKGLLSPNMAAKLRTARSHITLRACVSGKTTQVSSREALGMIWALFQAGACSVIAALWHSDVRSASYLLEHFYAQLRVIGSVPLALRAAALATRSAGGSWSHPYHYAVFTAFGYWNGTGDSNAK